MASNLEFVQYVAEQLQEAGSIHYKKMFGDYGLYCDGKYFACICDNRFLVKITKEGEAFLPECRRELPYDGAKAMFLIENLEDRTFLKELTLLTCAALPFPKPKKPRVKKED